MRATLMLAWFWMLTIVHSTATRKKRSDRGSTTLDRDFEAATTTKKKRLKMRPSRCEGQTCTTWRPLLRLQIDPMYCWLIEDCSRLIALEASLANTNPIQIQSKSNPIQANTTQHDLLMQMIMIVSALIQVLQTKLIAEWFKMIWRFTKRFEMI